MLQQSHGQPTPRKRRLIFCCAQVPDRARAVGARAEPIKSQAGGRCKTCSRFPSAVPVGFTRLVSGAVLVQLFFRVFVHERLGSCTGSAEFLTMNMNADPGWVSYL